MLRRYRKWYNANLHSEKEFVRSVRNICGLTPLHPSVFRLAFRHASLVTNSQKSARQCNERLEDLGDAVLGAVVSDYLFQKYPNSDEGYLTEMRSKVVNRKALNRIGYKLGLDRMLEYNRRHNGYNASMVGNSLEAFIGAVYTDHGFEAARQFIIRRILHLHIDLDELADQNTNYKSQLMEHVQKHKLPSIRYTVVQEANRAPDRQFEVAVWLGDECMGCGKGPKKKTAEQAASAQALVQLQVLTPTEAVLA